MLVFYWKSFKGQGQGYCMIVSECDFTIVCQQYTECYEKQRLQFRKNKNLGETNRYQSGQES